MPPATAPPPRLIPLPTRPESHLLATVQAAGIRELARTTTDELREVLADLSVGLTRQAASAAPKVFQLNRSLGPGVVVKLLVVVLRAFVDSVRVPDKMGAADVIECAEALAATYTHDSIKDIILALKEARLSGYKFYQALDPSQVFEIVAVYFDKKANWLEHQHRDQKAQGSSTEAVSVAQLGTAAPTMLASVALRIPEQHPARESLRRKLSITSAREKRRLITPAQAEQQRAEVRQVLSNGRRDYRPPRLTE
ncbi:hypothetical protein GKZ68_00285 [Hymenobacter sp. BRD128]|uniref:hypothetical protein n=1 Tax=Hymenobacter sp. BRD128 TaxID=2675878 RepID=UPI001563BC2F|nr:hypothetical protein [Hymenobacter sp. BRD128]QKG55209.1 hypothetical protein GKZ68_00285 [Hymenobacter sp. BRD128]